MHMKSEVGFCCVALWRQSRKGHEPDKVLKDEDREEPWEALGLPGSPPDGLWKLALGRNSVVKESGRDGTETDGFCYADRAPSFFKGDCLVIELMLIQGGCCYRRIRLQMPAACFSLPLKGSSLGCEHTCGDAQAPHLSWFKSPQKWLEMLLLSLSGVGAMLMAFPHPPPASCGSPILL